MVALPSDAESFIDQLMGAVREAAATGAVLVVEGVTDVALFSGLLECENLTIIDAEGRLAALAVGDLVPVEDALSRSVIIVLDADFDRITGKVADFSESLHIVFTDAHDVEVMIVSIEALRRRVLTTLLRCSLIEAIGIWNSALDYQVEVGLARLSSHCNGWSISLAGIAPPAISDDTGAISRGKLVEVLRPRLKASGVDIEPGELMAELESRDQWRASWLQVVDGHSLCKSIAWYAHQRLGRNVAGSQIEDGLRLACQREHLADTRFGQRIQDWCRERGVPSFL